MQIVTSLFFVKTLAIRCHVFMGHAIINLLIKNEVLFLLYTVSFFLAFIFSSRVFYFALD